MRSLLSDLRYGVRLLRASPGFTAVAVLTLALGIAVNTTVLSWVDAVRLHPYPGVGDPQGLALIETITPSGEILVNTSYLDYRDYRDTLTLVSGLAVARFTPLSVGEGGRTERAWAELVSANYFDVLKVKAVLGRAFLPEEGGDQPGAHPVAVISHRMTMVPVWEGHLGAQGLLRRPLQILMAVCSCCCSSCARTSPTCCSPARCRVRRSSPSGWRWAPAGAVWRGSSSPKPCCWPERAGWQA
jgi:hypothetical protein